MKDKKQSIKNALEESKKGLFVSEKVVDAWFYSLGADTKPDTLLNDEKEGDYDEWFNAKVQKTIDNLENGTEPLYKHEEIMKEVADLLKN